MENESDGTWDDEVDPTMTGRPRRPPPSRIPADPYDAECLAAEWMHWAGYHTVGLTGRGSDGGVDVVSREAVAQVKYTNSAVSRPNIQQLHGVASQQEKQSLFFARSGYSRAATEWARQVGMALFVIEAGDISPVNHLAREILDEAIGRAPLHIQRSSRRQITTLALGAAAPGLLFGFVASGNQAFSVTSFAGGAATGALALLMVMAARTLAQRVP